MLSAIMGDKMHKGNDKDNKDGDHTQRSCLCGGIAVRSRLEKGILFWKRYAHLP